MSAAETGRGGVVGLMCGREYSFPPAFIARVNELGAPHGVTAEMVTFGGTRMDEPARYRVIVDRISHEVEYYRGALKHAVLSGTYVINNPFWWTADDKFFNYSVMARLGCAIPKTVLLPQKGFSVIGEPGKPFHDPFADEAFFQALKHNLKKSVPIVEMDCAVNAPEFAKTCAAALLKNMAARASG